MSGVRVEDRTLSEMEFYSVAMQIRVEVGKLVTNNNVVPKRWSFYFGIPLAGTAKSLTDNLTRAWRIIPTTSANAIERRRYLTLAIADCYNIVQDCQFYIESRGIQAGGEGKGNYVVNPDRFHDLMALVDRDIELIAGFRKNVKVRGKQTTEEQLIAAQQEVERLASLKAEIDADNLGSK